MITSTSNIFLNDSIKAEVLKVNSWAKEVYEGLSLLDCFIAGHTWNRNKIDSFKASGGSDLVRVHMANYPNVADLQYRQFGVYNLPECSYMYQRGELLNEYLNDVDLHDRFEDPSLGQLKEMSVAALGFSPQVLFPIKVYILSRGLEDTHWDGILPNTTPVRTAIKFLFNKNLDNYSSTLLCRDIAHDLSGDVTPMYVNTALWVIGCKL